MRHTKQELLNLFGASAVATVFYEIISDYTPLQVTQLALGSYGRIGNWIVIFVFALVFFLLSSVISYFWLKHQGFKDVFITIFLGACIGAALWVMIGFMSLRYIPLDRTLSLFASFFSGLLLAGLFLKRSKNSSNSMAS